MLQTNEVSGNETFFYDLPIAADGPCNVVAREFGIPPSRSIHVGFQTEIFWDGNPDLVELLHNSSPDFSAWVIPLSTSRTRIGLCGARSVSE
jgi:flavin-dependent dehydrogenase